MGKNPPCNAGDMVRSLVREPKIPQAAEQLSLQALESVCRTRELVHRNERSRMPQPRPTQTNKQVNKRTREGVRTSLTNLFLSVMVKHLSSGPICLSDKSMATF